MKPIILNKPIIIGIGGNKNSGKDTAANMINYIMSVGAISANYQDWFEKINIYKSNNIVHFADKLKDSLSIIYNIPRWYFDDRDYKDEKFLIISRSPIVTTFVDKISASMHNVPIITIDKLKEQPLSYYTDTCERIYISIRTLLQYYGTNVCRANLGNNIWINGTISNAKNKCREVHESNKEIITNYCIIPDVRFENEADIVNQHGVLIYINRLTKKKDSHISEEFIPKNAIIVENNKTLIKLFYNILDIVSKEIIAQ